MLQNMEKVDLRVGTYQNINLRNNVPEAIGVIETIARLSNGSQELDLILFPELFLTGYDCGVEILIASAMTINSKEIEYIRTNICQKYHIAICFGYSERDNETIYNSAVLIDARGEVVMNYRKTHLWDPDCVYEKCAFSPGDSLPVADLFVERTSQSIRVGILICFDLEFPEPARVLRLAGASLILVPTAVVDTLPAQCMVRCRAGENLLFIVYSNFTGPCLISSNQSSFCGLSGVFGPDGRELVRAEADGIGLYTAHLLGTEFQDYVSRNNYLLERQEKGHLYSSITSTSA
jgi:5-aminopentanamidase